MEHYLDNAATTCVCPEAAEAALKAMTQIYGNPSSTHTKGREAKKLLDECRKNVAFALGADPKEVVFTSCGSESDNWAILSGAEYMKRKGNHIISSVAEHSAVRKALDVLESKGYEVTRLTPDKTGAIPADKVKEALREDTILVSLMMVNNETGAVTDIKEISNTMKAAGSKALLHTDAVQAFKKVPFKAKTLGADMISISGHKIHAVKGIGALYIRDGLRLQPLICGGEQENGRRAGTEALPQIASLSAACAADSQTEKIAEMKKYLIDKLTSEIPCIKYIDTPSPHILSISLPGWRAEVIMNLLETKEIYISRSSACRQGKRSHVLEAIGMSGDEIDGSLRIGISRFNTIDDLDALTAGLKDALNLRHK